MLAEGLAQRFVQRLAGLATARFTGLGSLAVSPVEGEGDEATRAGIRFHASALGSTGIALAPRYVHSCPQYVDGSTVRPVSVCQFAPSHLPQEGGLTPHRLRNRSCATFQRAFLAAGMLGGGFGHSSPISLISYCGEPRPPA